MARMLDLVALRRLLDRHVSGVGDWHLPLWTALMFLTWVRDIDRPVDVHATIGPAQAMRRVVTIAHQRPPSIDDHRTHTAPPHESRA